jgi:hypothetical protein
MYIDWRRTPVVLALGAVLVTGCERSIVAPVDEPEEYDLLWDLQYTGQLEAQAQHQRVAILFRLFRNALQHIGREEGRDAAEQAMRAVATIRAEARERFEAGDIEGARVKIEEARRAMAATVIRAFGTDPVYRLLDAVAERQAWIDRMIAEREAAGHDPRGLKRFAAHLAELTGTARAALERGEYAVALDYASRAAEAIVRFRDRRAGQT